MWSKQHNGKVSPPPISPQIAPLLTPQIVAQGYLCDTHMQELCIRHVPRQRSLITSYDTYDCLY
jgi:hypothetical protein